MTHCSNRDSKMAPAETISAKFRIGLILVATFLIAFALHSRANSQEPNKKFSASDIEFFENKVRPLLVEHCLKCHGEEPEKLRGGLHLTSRSSIFKGGDSGPAIVAGKPDESLLIQSVRYEEFEMPPKGQLKDSEIATLVKWIEMGAPDPRTETAAVASNEINIEEGKKFWAFKPRSQIEPPSIDQSGEGSDWVKTPIDAFVFDRLRKAQLSPVEDASRETLIRRAYISLVGLPPTPEQIDDFVNDESKTEVAFAKVVDRLLESKHFGERWGRHWLDVVRFAESSGGGRSLMFKDAWRFRDYVIDAYNDDKPFDQFIKEQIAGDLLSSETHEQKIERIIATGMLALGPTNYEQQDKELLRMEVVDEQVDTVGRAFLGLTLGCARCHDHKFDPIPTTDYYAMAGIFGSTQSLVDGNVSSYIEQSLASVAELAERKRYNQKVREFGKRLVVANKELKNLGVGQPQTKRLKTVDSKTLEGIVIDNRNAKLIGNWKDSTFKGSFVDQDYIHDDQKDKGKNKAIFSPKFPNGGQYEVRMSYTSGGSRASNVPVTINHQDGIARVPVNQSKTPPINGLFVSLGTFRFEADNQSTVTVETTGTNGHVIVDAIQFIKRPGENDSLEKRIDDLTKSRSGDRNDESKIEVQIQEPRKVRVLRKKIELIERELTALKKNPPGSSAVAMSVKEAANPNDGHVHIRGSVRNLGPIVKRGFISVCCDGDSKPELGKSESGRLQLAEWIASDDHPLTARVYVNRIWRHLFGVGLVETTDNFGMVGQAPSHPELLDYLANQFVENGWSTKKLIRQIMLSRVYQLGSKNDPDAFAKDDRNRLLWRSNRRRVDAEVLRDSILFVSGKLDLKPGGLTIRKFSQYDLGYKFDTVRRSVYVPAFRNSMLDLFEAFDFANPNLVIGHRNTSTLPTQALFLMNSPMVIRQSKAAAERFLAVENLNDRARIVLVYRTMLGRKPTESEIKSSLDYLASFEDSDKGEMEAWSSFCNALFASLDFRYIE